MSQATLAKMADAITLSDVLVLMCRTNDELSVSSNEFVVEEKHPQICKSNLFANTYNLARNTKFGGSSKSVSGQKGKAAAEEGQTFGIRVFWRLFQRNLGDFLEQCCLSTRIITVHSSSSVRSILKASSPMRTASA